MAKEHPGITEAEFFQKLADETPGDDEESTAVGTTHVHDDPPKRPEGNLDAAWGEKGPEENGRQDAQQHGEGVEAEETRTREDATKNLFDSRASADAAHQALLAQNLTHAASGDFTTHSLHLKPKAKLAHARTPTLSEQVLRVAGRY